MARAHPWILLLPTVLAVLIGGLVVAGYRADIPLQDLAAKYANEESEFIDVEGLRVHYRDEGRGRTPLLLLHGTGSSLHTWDGWIAPMSYEFRLIRVDLPGFGLTGPRADDDYSIDAYVRFVEAFVGRLGLESFHVAGNSLGGRIAWSYAVAHPKRVRKLVLIGASGYPRADAADNATLFRLARLPLIGRALTTLTPRFLVQDSLRDAYGNPGQISDELVDRYYELSLREGNRRAFLKRAGQTGANARFDHRDVTQPTLVVWGAEDRWMPLQAGRGFAADIDGARLLVYPGVGHLPMEELPGPTARAALSFLLGPASAP